MREIKRREFLKYSFGLLGLALAGTYTRWQFSPGAAQAEASEESGEIAPRRVVDGFGTEADKANRFGMVIDVGACIGCRTCQWACKEENNTPDAISPPWIEIFELKSDVSVTGHPSPDDLKAGATTAYTEAPKEGRWYLPVQCYHCSNAPCVKVCPTGATYKSEDGLTLMDYERCIGCRLCVVACPYSARRFNWWKSDISPQDANPLVPVRPIGVVEKCTFCVHRTRRGSLPRCVEVCPVRARHFGNMNDPNSEVAKILFANQSFQLLGELNTEPNIWYITRGKKWYKEK